MRARAIEMIGRKGWGRQNYLVHKAIMDGSDVVRWAAVRSAVALNDRASAAVISRQLLSEKDESLKLAMIEALLELRVDDSSNALAHLVRTDEKEAIRQRAAMAIGNLRIKDAGFALVQAIQKDPSLPVRLEAAASLGELGDPRLAESIMDLLTKEGEDRKVLQLAAMAVIRTGSDEKVRRLQSVADGLQDAVLAGEIRRMIQEYRSGK